MKYLLLYEAFESKGISGTIKFLKQKVGNNSTNNFLEELRGFMKNSNYPIDKLSDDFIKYMKGSEALKLKNDSDVSNPYNLWAIKWWFSLEKGFLGYTGTGNAKIDYQMRSSRSEGIIHPEKFSSSQFVQIKERFPTGEIYPVTDYNKLKTGDVIMGYFDHDKVMSKFAIATVYRERWGRTYAIQDVSNGSEPNDGGSWSQWGNYSWFLYEKGEMGSDHGLLHHYKPSSKELHYVKPQEEIENDNENNPLNWNLPMDGLNLKRWGWGDSMSEDYLKEADFALVLYFDNLINPDSDAPYFEPVSGVRSLRKSEKEGALALMSEEQVKQMNYDNLMSRMIQMYGITLDSEEKDLKNLQNMVRSLICGNNIFFSIWSNRPEVDDLKSLVDLLSRFFWVEEKTKKEELFSKIRRKYKDSKDNATRFNEKYNGSRKKVKDYSEDETMKLFAEIYKISEELNTLISKYKVENIDDFEILISKISIIDRLMKGSRYEFTDGVIRTLNNFYYNDSDVSGGIQNANSENMEDNYKKIAHIRRVCSQILK